jgi:hypothetical protein
MPSVSVADQGRIDHRAGMPSPTRTSVLRSWFRNEDVTGAEQEPDGPRVRLGYALGCKHSQDDLSHGQWPLRVSGDASDVPEALAPLVKQGFDRFLRRTAIRRLS